MKPILAVLLLSVILTSCTKEAVAVPQQAQLFYKDGNLAVSTMQAVQTNAATVKVSFDALYATNVQKIEVMSGVTTTQLCTIGELDLATNISKSTNFSVDDTNLKGKTEYYMLRYTLVNGDWGYTPLVSVSIK